jgi:hypothetical protein
LIDFSGSIAVGSSATATGFRNIAIGASAFSTGNTSSIGNSIAIGVDASTMWFGNSVAIGPGATCNANNQITIGTTSQSIIFNNITSNYLYYQYNGTNINLPDNAVSALKFDTFVNSTSLFTYNSTSFAFTNVSGRTLTFAASLFSNFSQTSASALFATFFLKSGTGNDRYGEVAYVSPQASSSNNRLNSCAILTLNSENSFSCCCAIQAGASTSYTDGQLYVLVF